jgi:hypothetical protein
MTQLLSSMAPGDVQLNGAIAGTQVGQPQSCASPCPDPAQRRRLSLRSSQQFFETALQRGQMILARWCNSQK